MSPSIYDLRLHIESFTIKVTPGYKASFDVVCDFISGLSFAKKEPTNFQDLVPPYREFLAIFSFSASESRCVRPKALAYKQYKQHS